MAWAPWAVRHLVLGDQRDWFPPTHMTRRERLLLYRLARRLAPGATIVEVGSYVGASACFLASAAREVGGGARVHCVDTWSNEGMSEGPRDTWLEFTRNVAHHRGILVPHRGRSTDVAGRFSLPVSLLFVDGDHSYDGCRADLAAWLPHVASGAVVVMHDFSWATGVQRAVSELLAPRQSGRSHVVVSTFWARVR